MPAHLERVINNKIDEAIAHVDRLIVWVEENERHAMDNSAFAVAEVDRVQLMHLTDARVCLLEAKR